MGLARIAAEEGMTTSGEWICGAGGPKTKLCFASPLKQRAHSRNHLLSCRARGMRTDGAECLYVMTRANGWFSKWVLSANLDKCIFSVTWETGSMRNSWIP